MHEPTPIEEAVREAVARIADLPQGVEVPEEFDWFPERTWGGRVWFPVTAHAEEAALASVLEHDPAEGLEIGPVRLEPPCLRVWRGLSIALCCA